MYNLIKPYLDETLKYKVLHISEVGSFMWQMNSSNTKGLSDHDIFVVYQQSTSEILHGKILSRNIPCKHDIILNGLHFDFQFIELAHFIHLLGKGNINMIWGLTTPLMYFTQLDPIREFIEPRINQLNILPSGLGMARGNIVERKEVRTPQKNINSAYRTLKWLSRALDNINKFDPVEDATIEQCEGLFETLRNLPFDYSHEEEIVESLSNGLYRYRLDDIES